MSSLVLARKWRPHTFDTIAGQAHVVQALTHALTSQRLHHAYLFTGTRGVGKTSIARILAKALSCEAGISAMPCEKCLNCQEIDAGRFVDLIEIDAASRSKVEDTREILDNTLYAPVRGRFKIYLIDEIHMLSGHSFNALLKTLEEPPEHVKFLLATTDPKKLPVTVLSRCLQFHLKNMLPQEITLHLGDILQKENIAYEASALPWIAQAADGSMRDALSLLDQAIAHGQNNVVEKNIREMLGYVETQHIMHLVEALIEQDGSRLLSISANLRQQGADCVHVLAELQSLLHQMGILQFVPDYQSQETMYLDVASQLAAKISPENLQLFYQIALKGSQDLALAPTPWIAFEMTLLRMLAFKPVDTSPVVPSNPSTQSEPKGRYALDNNCIKSKDKNEQLEKNADNWDSILSYLHIKGMASTIAQYCSLASKTDTHIILNIPLKHAALFTASIKNQIEEAISHYFAQRDSKNITVSFQVTQEVVDSPAVKQEEKKQSDLEKTKTSFDNDKNFQKILETFHGTIVPNSIKHTN